MKMLNAKRTLAAIWFSLGALQLAILIGQTVTDRYGEKFADVWTWFTVYYLPAATIVAFASSVGERDSPANEVVISHGALLTAALLSVLYLVLMLAPLLLQPFLASESPFDTLSKWGIILAIFQSIVVGSISAVYIRP